MLQHKLFPDMSTFDRKYGFALGMVKNATKFNCYAI